MFSINPHLLYPILRILCIEEIHKIDVIIPVIRTCVVPGVMLDSQKLP